MNTTKDTAPKKTGFTLIELLTVIAIIGILAAILFPVIGKVRETAGETAGRAQFGQWGQAFELFHQEYGYYPDFTTGTQITPNNLYLNGTNAEANYDGGRFYEALTGRVAGTSGGDRVKAGDEGFKAGNIRAASFYTFAEGELEEEASKVVIRDRFGNGDIVVLVDRTQDGIIKLGGGGNDDDYTFGVGSLPEVKSVRTDKTYKITTDDFSTDGVRASVIFYSAGYGNRLLMSWK